jgi:hypothetical protein
VGRKFDHSAPSGAEVNDESSYIYTPPHMAWLIENLTFTNVAEHMAPTGETRNTQRILVRKSERICRRKWKDNINIMGGGGANLCGPG